MVKLSIVLNSDGPNEQKAIVDIGKRGVTREDEATLRIYYLNRLFEADKCKKVTVVRFYYRRSREYYNFSTFINHFFSYD